MKFDILTVLVGIAVTIMMAGIPWAYQINARLVSIEASMNQIRGLEIPPSWFKSQVDKNELRIDSLRQDVNLINQRLIKLERTTPYQP